MDASRLPSSRAIHAHRRPSGLARAALVLLVLGACNISYPAFGHPKPGAHADVRIVIEKDVVRFDVLMNILFADQLVNAPRQSRDAVTDEEEPTLERAMSEYFGTGRPPGLPTALIDRANRVVIDGIETSPVIRELQIVHPPPETRPGFDQNPALLLPRIHVIAEYPCKSAPKQVQMVWGAFPRDFIAQARDLAPPSDIEAVVTGNGELTLVSFRKTEPEYTWHAPRSATDDRFAQAPLPPDAWKPPMVQVYWPIVLLGLGLAAVVSAGCVKYLSNHACGQAKVACAAAAGVGMCAIGAGVLALVADTGRSRSTPPVSESTALAVFAPLHANIYRAFDYTRETEIYDALARSVDGPMLDQIYNDVYRGLIMQEEGGALARVRAVTPISTRVIPLDAAPPDPSARSEQVEFAMRALWQVDGVVYHWGHSHSRSNEYLAEYRVAARASGWRIVGVRPLEQRRIESSAQAESSAGVNRAATRDPSSPGPSSPPSSDR